jgi:S1-C subfamily serine protease
MTDDDRTQPAEAIPPPARRPPRSRRVGAMFAIAIVLVLVSAVVGAGLEIALHRTSSSAPNPTRFEVPAPPSDGSGASDGTQDGSSSSSSAALDVNAIASRVDAGIVNIDTTLANGREAAGTGMVITSSGEVLTNNHVIEGASKIRLEIGATGDVHTASVVGYDVTDDVALLRIADVSNLKAIPVGNSSGVQVNDPVVAIGNALGRFGPPTAVGGVVTGVGRTITAGDTAADTETLSDMIQIQAAIQPGDSGGPLVDRSAKVIGMNTAADTGSNRFGYRTGSAGFAIPIDKAMSIVHQIEAGDGSGNVHLGSGRALLGVALDPSANGGQFGGLGSDAASGAVVAQVQSGGAADSAGLKAGDVIVSVDGTSIGSAAELRTALQHHNPGDKVKLGWLDSSGAPREATVMLDSGPPA